MEEGRLRAKAEEAEAAAAVELRWKRRKSWCTSEREGRREKEREGERERGSELMHRQRNGMRR